MVTLDNDTDVLPILTLRQIDFQCRRLSIPTSVVQHAPTFTALETQAVLPKDCLVQKTVTGRVADKIVLWTGVGDYHVTRSLRKAANQHLGLSNGRDHTLNPRDIDACAFYNMHPGMVSPFLVSKAPAIQELAALFVLDWTQTHNSRLSVAISLSLTESLILPLHHLNALLHAYAKEVYSRLPVFTLSTLEGGK